MIELVAADEASGWAFVVEGDTYYLIRPPYRRAHKQPVSAATVERAVTRQGFSAATGKFADLGSLVDYLRRKIVEAHEAAGEVIPDTQQLRRLARLVPPETVARYLDRIERELLPDRKWAACESLLRELLQNPAVSRDPDRVRRCAELLARCAEGRRQEEEALDRRLDDLRPWDELFPTAGRLYGPRKLRTLAATVEGGGDVWALAA